MDKGKNIARVVTIFWLITILLCGNSAIASGVEVGKARGILNVDGFKIDLKWAYAIKALDTFDPNKKVTVIALIDSPIDEKPFPNKIQLMFKGRRGEMKGVMAEVDTGGKLTGIEIYSGENSSQFSGSVPFNLESLSIDEKQVGGKLTSLPEEAKTTLDVVFLALIAETDKCIERFSVDEETWEKLPMGGGKPGKAFMIFDQAYRKGDVNAVKAGLCPAWANDITPDTFKKRSSMRAQDIKITGGFLKGDKAMLTGEGMSPITEEKASITVWMSKMDSGWKVVRQRDR